MQFRMLLKCTSYIFKLRPLLVAEASSSCFYRLAGAEERGSGSGRGGSRKGIPPALHFSQYYCSLINLKAASYTDGDQSYQLFK